MPRIESDALGPLELPDEALWGVHTQRARLNFPSTGRVLPRPFIRAFAMVKQAAAQTHRDKGVLTPDVAEALVAACRELADGGLDAHMVVDPLAGGAGTSINMNVNEVLANRANELLGQPRGSYAPAHPLDTVNRSQSTNDTFPTAVRVAALWLLADLEKAVTALQNALQDLERRYADLAMVGRTQLQDAVPLTAGQVFGAWAEAAARDRWRVFKCTERLKTVNLGGAAIGTGLGASRSYIFGVIEHLRRLTGLPLSRAENPVEATSNQDALVEADGILSALASNLLKLSGDLRLLSMPAVGELRLPAMQAGSTIMPGKVNPVIPEYVAQLALTAMGGHGVLAMATGLGNLQLSQFLPLVAFTLLDHLHLLARAAEALAAALPRVEMDTERCRAHLAASLSVGAALVPSLGYEAVERAVHRAQTQGLTLRDALCAEGVAPSLIEAALSPSRLRRLGGDETDPAATT